MKRERYFKEMAVALQKEGLAPLPERERHYNAERLRYGLEAILFPITPDQYNRHIAGGFS